MGYQRKDTGPVQPPAGVPRERTLLSPVDAARYLGLAPQTLAKARLTGQGPTYAKLGARRVMYRLEHLDAWVDARTRTSTSDEPRR